VFGDVEDGFEDVDTAALDRSLFQQDSRIELAKNVLDVSERGAE